MPLLFSMCHPFEELFRVVLKEKEKARGVKKKKRERRKGGVERG